MADLTLEDIPPALLEEAVSRRLREIRDSKREERMRAMGRFGDPQPETSAFKAISEGRYRRKMRPKIMLEDRGFVPAALRHWRQVHNLTARQAQARIGYSPRSCSWSHWESGFVAPPYRTLLAIIAATGLGYWVDDERAAGVGGLLLDQRRAAHQQALRRRARKRKAAPV